jgi:anti-sigma regulatory factor (Ser/Thr protein kinase)/anti-anti-sigma regulatory factor
MSIDTKKSQSILVPEDLDDDSLRDFFNRLEAAIADQPSEVLLDCSSLEHATSRHINALWDALNRCQGMGIPMRLTAVGYGLRRVLNVLDLTELFTVEYEGERGDRGVRPLVQDRPTERFEVEFDARIEAVTEITAKLQTYLEGLDLSEITVFDLESVFYEVATNICRHSGLDEDRKIGFLAEVGHDDVSFEFTDAGERFDPTGNTPEFDPRLAIKRRQSRGIGLVMIQRLMDSISYQRVDQAFNVVRLTKRLRPGVEVGE